MEPKIQQLIREWEAAQKKYLASREAYRVEHAKAFLASTEKTGDAKKADADVKTSELRLSRDYDEMSAASAWQSLLAERGRIESASMPGKHFGEEAA